MSTVLHKPSPYSLTESSMAKFMHLVNERHGSDIEGYAQLHSWSVENRQSFWKLMLEFAEIRCEGDTEEVLRSSEQIWQDRWFPRCRLNFAENLLRFRDNRTALRFFDEQDNQQKLSYAQLHAEVSRIAGWLRARGVSTGDRVAGFAANRIETIVAMLATASLGAVWTSCSPDFGINGILDRFIQIEPKILFAVGSHLYAGKVLRHEKTLAAITASLPSLEVLVILPELYGVRETNAESGCELILWQDIRSDTPLEFAAVDFNSPLFIMYSSGTTGVPKCIVHGVGGTLLQHRKEHMLHVDLHRDDVFFYFTTCGWMMWNWLVSGLASGATLVLYDGSPFHPSPSRLIDIAQQEGISIFGVSAKYLSALEKAGVRPAITHKLPALRTILSTGSPLSAEGFDFVYRDIKSDVALQSISGGTDIISCFVLGAPLLPVYRGEIQCAGLGMDVSVFDEDARPVKACKGELVCRRSFPSMPVGFWNDPDDVKYRAAYFERFPGVWTHGDYAEQTERDTFIIYGRSDTVLNPGGVRIGTAEIYRQVEQLPDILEAVAVGQQWEDDVRIVLCVRLAPSKLLDPAMQQQIRQSIRQGASPRHVPAVIAQVQDIPRTLSGKIAETAVRQILNGETVGNADALANPAALEEYRSLRAQLSI